MPESRPAFLREVINALLTPDSSAADLSLKSDSDVSSARLRNQTHPPRSPVIQGKTRNPKRDAGLCKDYKKDIFGRFAYDFELSQNILSFLI